MLGRRVHNAANANTGEDTADIDADAIDAVSGTLEAAKTSGADEKSRTWEILRRKTRWRMGGKLLPSSQRFHA